MRRLCDRVPSMNRLGGDDAIIASRNLAGISRRIEFRRKVGRAREAESIVADGVDVLFPEIVGPNFRFALPSEMRRE